MPAPGEPQKSMTTPTPLGTAPRPAMQSPLNPISVNTGPATASVIGTDLTIIGNLQSKGEIQVEGTVQGDILASRIVIGANAKITGGLVADDIVVRGTVMGSIRGNHVTLQANSRVEGDVFHQSLAIEQGAYFEGKSRRSENPKEMKPMVNGADQGISRQAS